MSTLNVRADRKALAEAATWVALAIPRLHSVPALTGIRLRAEGDELTLSAYGYEISHEARVPAEVHSPGEVLASGAFLRAMLSAMPGRHVDLAADEAGLVLTSGRTTYRTQLLPLDEYPATPAAPPEVGMIAADLLGAAVNACAAPVDDAAPVAGTRGMRLEAGDQLDVVGLSSSLVIHWALDWAGKPFEVTLPSVGLLAALKGMSGSLAIGHSATGFSLADERRRVLLRVMDGEFAKWRKVDRAPEADRFAVTVDRDTLADAIKRAGTLSRAAKDASPVALTIEHDSIELGTSSEGAGGSEVIDAEGDGRELIHFADDLLAQAVAAMPPGPVRLGIGPRRNPAMGGFMTVRPTEGDNHRAIVAPRTGGEAR